MKRISMIGSLALLSCAVACGADQVKIDDVPVGSEVAVTRDDGGVVQGTLADRDGEEVRVDLGRSTKSVPRDQIASVQLVNDTAPLVLPPTARYREVTVPAGTAVDVQLQTPLNTETTHIGDVVAGTVNTAITLSDAVVIPAGSRLKGEVTAVEEPGKVKGRASVAFRFSSLSIAGHDDPYTVALGLSREAPATKGEDAKKIAIPAAGGALIGAILGGKKGAVIGGAIGGGAGTAVVLSTEGQEVVIPAGTVLDMRMELPVDLRIPVNGN